MKVLWLGPDGPLGGILAKNAERVIRMTDRVDVDRILRDNFTCAVSYGYRNLVQPNVITALKRNIVNLHISLLPWNRGADPNLWSFLEDTPKGVSIHWLDEGLDTGPVIAQQEISFVMNETLASSYARLSFEIVRLFENWWPVISAGHAPAIPQKAGGSMHRAKDKEPYLHLLTRGWNTPVQQLIGKAL